MKILLDSNVMIAAYPVTGEADEYSSEAARRLLRLANEHGHTTFRHPASLAWDFDNVRDRKVREWRKNTASVIPELQDPPAIQPEIVHCAGRPARGTSDWVDQHMLAAVVGDAVDILVTEDRGILRTASCLELGERVVPIDDALAAISARAPRPPDVALLPRYASAYELNETDPIFESLREDYPGFDDWLRKCKREHRRCWTLRRNGSLAALAIVKDNEDPAELVSEEIPLDTKLLKISTFKVAADSPGLRYGELLLKSVFAYAYENSYEYAYVTTLPKHQNVVSFLEQFGFRQIDTRTTLGEIVMLKALRPRADQHPADALAYHLEFGPLHYRLDVDRFLVPIAPRYHTLLFPEADDQQQLPGLATSVAAGNGILKAYLSRSGIRSIRPGAILYFYRSHDRRSVGVIGIAESTLVSESPETVSAYLGKRTAYTPNQIRGMTDSGARPILAILFRQSRVVKSGPTDAELREAGVWQSPPQSIMMAQREGAEWLRTHIDLSEQ